MTALPYRTPISIPPPPNIPRDWEIDWIDQRPRRDWIIDKLTRYYASPAYVQSATGTASAASTVVSGNLTATANNCLVGFVCYPTANALAATPFSDTLAQTWTAGATVNNASGAKVTPCYCNNTVGGTTALTATFTANAANAVIILMEYSGCGAIAGNRSLIDQGLGATGNNSSPTASPQPQQSSSLLVSAVGDAVGGITYTASGSITRRQSVTSPIGLAAGDQVTSATSIAAFTSAWSASGTVQWTESNIILRPASQQAVRRLVSAGIASAATLTSASYTPQLGSVLLAFVQTVTTGRVTNSVADTASESWSLVTGSRAVNASGGELSAWLCNGTRSTAARTFSATPDAATAGNITIIELTGVVANTNLVDQVKTGTGNGTAISLTTNSATAIPGEVAILAVGAPATTTSTQPGGSDALVADTSSANGSMGVTTRLLNAVGSPNLTATLGTTRQYSAVLITLQTGGVSFVQSIIPSSGTGQSTSTGTFTFNTAAGNAFLASVGVSGSRTMTSISDGTNSYVEAIAQINGTVEASTWYAASITGGKAALTLTRSGNGALSAIVREYSGLEPVTILDTTGVATGTGTTATITSATPTAEYVLSILTATDSATGNTWVPSSPFISVQTPPVVNINVGGGSSTTFTTTPAAISGSLTSGATTPDWAATIAVFRVAGSPLVGVTRTITMSAALQTTLSRTVPQAAALSILAQTRDIPQSAGLQTTVSRQVPQSAAFQATLSRQIPESAALSVAALSRTVAQTVNFTILNRARQINQYAELSQVVTYLHRSGVLLEWGSEYEVMLATSDVPIGASGGTSRLTVEIRDHSMYRDPSTVMLLIDAPDGTRTQLTYGVDAALHRLAQGVYYSDLTRSQTGIYTVTWSDGTPQGWASDVVVST